MIDAARIAEAFRKRGTLRPRCTSVTDFRELGELAQDGARVGAPTPCASASIERDALLLGLQGLGRRHWELGGAQRRRRLSRRRVVSSGRERDYIAYGDRPHPLESAVRPARRGRIALNGHLDLMENGLVGLLGARELIEPLIVVVSGGTRFRSPTFYRGAAFEEYFERCASAGLGDRAQAQPRVQISPEFLQLTHRG